MEASELYDCYSEVKDLLAYLIEGRFLDSTHWIALSVGKSRENPSPKLTFEIEIEREGRESFPEI